MTSQFLASLRIKTAVKRTTALFLSQPKQVKDRLTNVNLTGSSDPVRGGLALRNNTD